ncbi:class I SAM-dependent methyltransferase [Dactylosporangium darangshiense]|uniref:Class I SAM-dependent methyltransferase n=2 Tax=Dactylosporangium darangshiense TaxID=579108 RepID=A0ABP8DNU7_9ACTN
MLHGMADEALDGHTPLLGAVQETMLVTLHARATAGDADAARLVAAIDYDFARFERHAGPTAVFHVLRSNAMDEWTRRFLAERPHGTVVELGAGLSTRGDRLDNGTAHWCYVDLPDAAEFRRALLPDGERRRTITGSVLDPGWADEVAAEPGPYLFLAEGVLVYLDPVDVRRALSIVATRFPGCRIALDTYGEWIIAKPRGPLAGMAADLVWSCEDPKALEEWDLGLTLRESWPLSRPDWAVRRGLSRRTRAVLAGINTFVPRKMTNTRVNLFSVDAAD